MLTLKNSGSKKLFYVKEFLSEKTVSPNKFGVKKNWGKKNCGPEKIFLLRKNLGERNYG